MNFSISININSSKKIVINDFEIKNEKINFLFGESGIGKTLLAKALLGLLDKEDFDVIINQQPYSVYLKNLGVADMINISFYVSQEPSGHLSPVLTIEEQFERGKLINASESEIILKNLFPERTTEELTELLSVYPKPFRPSGGEKQRILNSMALMSINNLTFSNSWNTLFIFDEPTGHLDTQMRNKLLDEIYRLFIKDKPTILFITHDYSIIGYMEKRFSDVNNFFTYTEIFKQNEKLIQKKFNTFEYLRWISEEKSFTQKEGKIILKLKTGVNVFGKHLDFYLDEKHENKTDLILHEGEILYLKAPSGSGKTTVAKILLGLIKADFEAEIDGIKINRKTAKQLFLNDIYGKKITMAFQHADEALNPKSSVEEIFYSLPNVDIGELRRLFKSFFSLSFDDFRERKIETLSGGQKQKINLLRSLLLKLPITILDEPFYGMDLESVKKTIKILKSKVKEGRAFIVISHNEDIFCKLIPNKIFLANSNSRIK